MHVMRFLLPTSTAYFVRWMILGVEEDTVFAGVVVDFDPYDPYLLHVLQVVLQLSVASNALQS